jgi:hypothetical protein
MCKWPLWTLTFYFGNYRPHTSPLPQERGGQIPSPSHLSRARGYAEPQPPEDLAPVGPEVNRDSC